MLEAININKIIKEGNKQQNILKNVNCYFFDHGLYFICGKSGSGKTTLLNILSTIDNSFEGEVRFYGEKITGKSNMLENLFSISFQNFNLVNELTVYENLELQNISMGIRDNKNIDDLLEKFNLTKIKEKNISQISGGEIQRISIIRSLLKDPKVIFLDEPTGSVDASNAEIIFSMLKKLSHTKLIIVVSHDTELVKKYADYIYFIDNGEIMNKELSLKNSDNKRLRIISDKTNKNNYINNKNTKNIFFKIFSNRFQNIGIYITLLLAFIVTSVLILTDATLTLLENKIDQLFFNSNYYSISKKINISENKNLSVIQIVRPEENELSNIKELKDCFIDISFDYLFNSSVLFVKDKEIFETVIFEPYYGEDDNFYCNEAFSNSIGNKQVRLEINVEFEYLLEGEKLYNKVSHTYTVERIDLRNDVLLINVPVLYYPYNRVKNDFLEIKCYEDGEKQSNVYKYLRNSKNDDDVGSYKLVVFSKKNKVINLNETLQDIYMLDNRVLESWKSFKELIVSSSNFIWIFNIISYIGAFCVIGFSIFSRILFNKKNIAILKVLGLKNKNIQKFLKNNIIPAIIFSILSSVCLILFAILILSFVLPLNFYEYANSNIMINLILLFFVFILFVEIFLSIYRIYLNKINIKKELNSQ